MYFVSSVHLKSMVILLLSPQEKGVHPILSVSNICLQPPDEIVECAQPSLPGPTLVHSQEEYISWILNSFVANYSLCEVGGLSQLREQLDLH